MKKVFLMLLAVTCTVYCAEKDDKKDDKDKKENFGTVIGIDLGTTYSWYRKV